MYYRDVINIFYIQQTYKVSVDIRLGRKENAHEERVKVSSHDTKLPARASRKPTTIYLDVETLYSK